jgi:phage terminase small subunit
MAASATLSEKEARFAHSYVFDKPSVTAAAIKAGYSKKTAHSIGSRLLKRVKVAAEVERLRKGRELRTQLSADWVITNLMTEAVDRSEAASQASRVRANELLGKHLGMFREKLNVEVSGKDGQAVELQVVMLDNGRTSQPATDIDLDAD